MRLNSSCYRQMSVLLKYFTYEEICDHIYYKQNWKDVLEVNLY